MMTRQKSNSRFAAVFAVFLMLAVLFVPISSDCDTDAAVGETYTYTISPDGTISGGYEPIGSSSTGKYTSVNGTNSGSWAFDEDGYGPFNSFYAAFDIYHDNRMIGILDPDDLTRFIDGRNAAGENYNIMWCLPTVYWYTDSSGNLVLTNDPDAGGIAYAHTIEGQTYRYIAIGVYEGYYSYSLHALVSHPNEYPTVDQTRSTFREQANNQSVNTNGDGVNGYAMVWNFYQWELYKYCALAVMGGWNSQDIAGNGNVHGGRYTYPTGTLDRSGPYAGTRGDITNSSYNKDSVKVFIENAWGGSYDFVDGIVFSDRQYYIDQSAVPTDAKSGTYITHISASLPSDGWGSSPSSMVQIWGMPTANSGSSSSGLYDYVYSSTGDCVLYVGGYSDPDSSAYLSYGLSSVGAGISSSDFGTNVGGRLAFVFDPMGNTVTFDHTTLTSAGGNASNLATSTSVPIGESLQLPNFGAVGDFTHIGWYIGGVFYEPGATYTPTGDITIQSAWLLPSVTITFSVEGSTYATLSVPKGSTGIVFTPVDVKGIFTGWFYDPGFEDEYDPVSPITTDITLYAKGAPPLIFTTDPVADGDIVALSGQPGTISFRATDSEDFTSVLWDFGDGQVSTALSSTHYSAEPGSHTATLPVYNNPGSDTMEFLIEVPQMAPGGGAMTFFYGSPSGSCSSSQGVWSSEGSCDITFMIPGAVA